MFQGPSGKILKFLPSQKKKKTTLFLEFDFGKFVKDIKRFGHLTKITDQYEIIFNCLFSRWKKIKCQFYITTLLILKLNFNFIDIVLILIILITIQF